MSRAHAAALSNPVTPRRVALALPPAKTSFRVDVATRCQAQAVKDLPVDRAQGLRQVDELCSTSGSDESQQSAADLVQRMKDAGLLTAFGAGRQVPKRLYTLEDLRLNKIESQALLSPEDATLNSVRTKVTALALLGLLALSYSLQLDLQQVGALGLVSFFIYTADQIATGGGGSSLVIDTLGRIVEPQYKQRVALHESGHFLVAYLLGLLPTAYTLSSLDAYRRARVLNVQAGCTFADGEFQREVASGQLKASSVQRFTCVALAGVATEYVRYGRAEGGLSDIQQLDTMLKALSFSQKKADGEIRWAVLNTVEMLRRHASSQDALAAKMLAGCPVGECIATLEDSLRDSPDL